ncbi:MAG: hypothetical protein Unbinned3338contig1000_51 [Prokaryotic dsDNA virus sp.]|nr:MAG: hypothetical protein Unbinned3338contig1000_51 [Prokaryotic dsDNA virus sp.]|tara:strand:+ start:11802 stop:12026 length:225 start_codon:yes stop_codon:yes gene_type:complete
MHKEYMDLEEKAKNLIAFARNTNENELDNVVKAIVNFARDERIKLLQELAKHLGIDETIIGKRQRQETAKLFKR